MVQFLRRLPQTVQKRPALGNKNSFIGLLRRRSPFFALSGKMIYQTHAPRSAPTDATALMIYDARLAPSLTPSVAIRQSPILIPLLLRSPVNHHNRGLICWLSAFFHSLLIDITKFFLCSLCK